MDGHKNLAAVLYGKEDIRVVERPVTEPREGQVQVAIQYVGICGTDIYYWKYAKHGNHDIKKPSVMGHEASGEVTKVGPGVIDLKVGDRVTIEPINPCFQCKNCKMGKVNVCLTEKAWDPEEFSGSIMRLKTLRAASCHKLPDNISLEEAALIEPMAVAEFASRRTNMHIGQKILIIGADVIPDRLELAKQLGARKTLLTSSNDETAIMRDIIEVLGEEPDVTLECSGVQFCQGLGIKVTCPGGIFMFIGVGLSESTLPLASAGQRQVDMLTLFKYDGLCFPNCIDMVSKGQVNLKPLITDRLPLEETSEALRKATSRNPGVVKVLVDCRQKTN